MKKKLIAILCAAALLIPMALLPITAVSSGTQWTDAGGYWTNYTKKTTPDYSFAVIGDIQFITAPDVDYDTHFTRVLFDWIVNNKTSRNIQYVFGLGDSINTLSSWPEDGYNTSTHNPAEWNTAATQFARLTSAGIPYMVVRGNHDDEAGFHKYICTTDYKNQMSGFFYDESAPAKDGNSMSNSYRKITIGGTKYLMLGLDYNIYNNKAVRDWANSVISANPDHTVIITVHAYLTSSGGRLNGNVGEAGTNQSDGDEWTDFEYFSGTQLWNEIFSKHANIAAVMCGHASVDVPIIQTRTGTNGNDVIEILVDPQDCDEYRVNVDGGNRCGFVLMLNFSENGKKIECEYISTARINSGKTNAHLTAFQNKSYINQTVDVTLDTSVNCTTLDSASVRLSTTKTGLRFKTTVSNDELQDLINTYGKSNVAVGTIIAPTDKLGNKKLTHSFGIAGVNYIDVKADIDLPFANANGIRTYAGTISNIKQKNLDRDFTAVGYIAYRESAQSAWIYVYSDSSVSRSIDYVATAALNDSATYYTLEEREIMEKLTVKYHNDIIKDPFVVDPF